MTKSIDDYPEIVHSCVGAIAFSAGLAMCQLTYFGLRISAATPLAPSTFGVMGVAVASAFAGQVIDEESENAYRK